MKLKRGQKDIKKEFLENKIGLLDYKNIEEINRLGSNKISSEKKGDRIMDI